jgi:flagellar motility protein MotE (MotC chaperone)
MKKTSNKRSTPAILSVIAALFIGSAVVRLAGGVGEAMALDAEPLASLSSAPQGDTNAMIAALNARETRLAEREAALADRMQALGFAEARAAERIAELRTAEAALAATISLADQAAERDLAQLTSLYEAMKPKDAAALFEEMAPEFAAGFLSRMQTEAAANVMAGLSPRAAYSISVILAGRNVGAPKE